MLSSLQFDNYKVIELKYVLNPSANRNEEEVNLNPTFSVRIANDKNDQNKAAVRLSVEIGEEDISSEVVRVEIIGFFTFHNHESFNREEISDIFKVNGTAILFPYLRSLVSDLTSKGDESPIIIPTINVNTFFEEEEEEE